MSWRDGYVIDVPYTRGVYLETSPYNLSLCALLAGVEAPDPARPHRHLELGCGAGVGVCLLAAANPHAQFVGVDFNPAHVAAGRRLIAAAGLENATLVEASFHELAEGGGLGRFDYVAAHGVWTWVSRQVQADMVRVLDGAVEPGGLVYMGYNNMAGWTGGQAMQRILLEHAARVPGDSLTKIRAAIRFVLDLKAADPDGLDTSKLDMVLSRAEGDVDRLPVTILTYLAHEYLNEHWRPVFPMDLESDLAEAKLGFVGWAEPQGAVPELVFTAAQRKAAEAYLDAAASRRLVDLITPLPFRRDLFCRGGVRLSREMQAERLRALRLRLVAPLPLVPKTVEVKAGRIELDEAAYRPVLERLVQGPATVGELLDAVTAADRRMGAAELLAVSLGSGWAALDAEAGGRAQTERTRRYNRAMISSMRDQPATRLTLASPMLGTGVSMTPLQVAGLLQTWGDFTPPEAEREAVEGVVAEWGDTWRTLGVV